MKVGLGLDGFMAGWGGDLAQGEGGFGPGWIYGWVAWGFSSG